MTSEVKYTVGFEDGTEQVLTIGPFTPSAMGLQMLKANIMEFNANFDSDTAALMTSKYGNKWTGGIKKAQVITTDIVNYV